MADEKRPATWSPTIERRFLEELATSANVTRSAVLAGTNDKRAWQRRQVDGVFRTAFLRALAEGYLRLEFKMLERALARAFGGPAEADAPSVQEERGWLQLLRQHRAAVQATDIFDEIEDLAVVQQRIGDKLAEIKQRLVAGEVSALDTTNVTPAHAGAQMRRDGRAGDVRRVGPR
ncbi:MAG TPA: hypothetical protein VF649_00750 [Sphingomonas sp.]|jgi:hypothetical protein|uniref:hypothetical protein n=1 Tax=Sphingomonas sp. TaxID=28214 RepID=UPI002ED82DD7